MRHSQTRVGPPHLLYCRLMWWCCRGPLAKAVSILLLFWTAADLSVPSLCALDNEGTNQAVVTTTEAFSVDGATGMPAPTPGHVDDCFCCSSCVDVQWAAAATIAPPCELQQTHLLLPLPRIFGSRLYRPPLA